MGALLSIPLIPLQLAITSISSCVGAGLSAALLSAFGTTFESSMATRLVYAIGFVFDSLLAWASLSDWAVGKLDLLKHACKGDECTGFVAVHRITGATALFHLALAGILSSVPAAAPTKTKNEIQNGWWRSKIFAWVLFLVLNFFLSPSFWVFWGNYVAPIGSFVFILIGLVLLVDCAHSWAENCVQKIEESESPKGWQVILVGSTVGMYVCALIITIVMYAVFSASGCSMNQAAVTLNLIFSVLVTGLSIHPAVQERNPQAGLAQSAMVSLYCAYLTMSAVASEPDDKHCNPLIRSHGTRTASIVIGALFTFLAIAYTTTRAASRNNNAEPDDSQINLRNEALRQAVADGTLPASALEDEEWMGARDSPNYNYILFHIIFFLATQYTATLLTMNVEKDPIDDFVPVGRTYFASWTKIISAWICYGLYSWSLLAPVLMPDRFA